MIFFVSIQAGRAAHGTSCPGLLEACFAGPYISFISPMQCSHTFLP
jgi:hypothetical protein